MPPNLSRRIASAMAIGVLAGAPPTVRAAEPFTLVRAQIDVCHAYANDCELETLSAERLAEVGSAPQAYAKARAGYGDNGAYAIAHERPSYLGAYAESIWVDAFTLSGGSGTGLLDISVRVEGSLSGAGQPGGPGPNSIYALYISSSGFSAQSLRAWLDAGLPANPTGASAAISMTEAIDGARVFSARLPFTYGSTFYLASYLGAEVLGEGRADFFGSAHLGITAPDGSRLSAASGFGYQLASAVPEPPVWLLFLAPLPAVLARRLLKRG